MKKKLYSRNNFEFEERNPLKCTSDINIFEKGISNIFQMLAINWTSAFFNRISCFFTTYFWRYFSELFLRSFRKCVVLACKKMKLSISLLTRNEINALWIFGKKFNWVKSSSDNLQGKLGLLDLANIFNYFF